MALYDAAGLRKRGRRWSADGPVKKGGPIERTALGAVREQGYSVNFAQRNCGASLGTIGISKLSVIAQAMTW